MEKPMQNPSKAREIRVLAALPEGQSSVPSTHLEQLTTTYNAPGHPNLLASIGSCLHTHIHTLPHANTQNESFKKRKHPTQTEIRLNVRPCYACCWDIQKGNLSLAVWFIFEVAKGDPPLLETLSRRRVL